MTHLTEEQLLDLYYSDLESTKDAVALHQTTEHHAIPLGGAADAATVLRVFLESPQHHLDTCADCRAQLESLRETLDALRGYPGPLRHPATHAAQVWARLSPQLPSKRHPNAFRLWAFIPAVAALLAMAFFIGEFAERHRHHELTPISGRARERVLLLSLSDHLQQAQIVLTNVANAEPGSPSLQHECDRAHELLGANRILRQAADRLGDYTDSAVLDQLERTLLDIANTPLQDSPDRLRQVQEQIENGGLLFKVRVTQAADLHKGQKL